jgi:hypothetical protein
MNYPVMLALSLICLFALVYLFARWIVGEWVAVWRQRPPIVRGEDGIWRAASRRR